MSNCYVPPCETYQAILDQWTEEKLALMTLVERNQTIVQDLQVKLKQAQEDLAVSKTAAEVGGLHRLPAPPTLALQHFLISHFLIFKFAHFLLCSFVPLLFFVCFSWGLHRTPTAPLLWCWRGKWRP